MKDRFKVPLWITNKSNSGILRQLINIRDASWVGQTDNQTVWNSILITFRRSSLRKQAIHSTLDGFRSETQAKRTRGRYLLCRFVIKFWSTTKLFGSLKIYILFVFLYHIQTNCLGDKLKLIVRLIYSFAMIKYKKASYI